MLFDITIEIYETSWAFLVFSLWSLQKTKIIQLVLLIKCIMVTVVGYMLEQIVTCKRN